MVVFGWAAAGSAAASGQPDQPGQSDPVAQEQPSQGPSPSDSDDEISLLSRDMSAMPSQGPSPSDSDDEIRVVMALLIAVAAVALLGTLVYWVRTGDRSRPDPGDEADGANPEDTLG